MTLSEAQQLARNVEIANRAAWSPLEIAQAIAKEAALAERMGDYTRQVQAERAAQAEAEQRAKVAAENAKREAAEDAYMERAERAFQGSASAWRAVRDQVLANYRQQLLEGPAKAIAAKRAMVDYSL
jgi:hypothetical protein